MRSIFTETVESLSAWLKENGERSFRARQILEWVFKKKVDSWSQMTNLSASLKEKLKESFSFLQLKEEAIFESVHDGTTKYLFGLFDGKRVESVLILAPDRRTVCVSSQVGCPARCAFCASGKEGLIRNLTAEEIVEQIWRIDALLRKKEERVCHVVFMGMGEPLENYDAVVEAIQILSDPERGGISQRKITLSTVGIIDRIIDFAGEGLKVNLALSLHAPNQKLRQKLLPFARKNELKLLMDAMQYYAKTTKRDITYEYTLIEGINDSEELAEELALLVKDHPCTVNLIPYNPVAGLRLSRPSSEAIDQFQKILTSYRVVNTRRYTKGKEIAAACGQLALHKDFK